jgi:hypothetical protein
MVNLLAQQESKESYIFIETRMQPKIAGLKNLFP